MRRAASSRIGQAVEPYGVVSMTHPQVGDCSRHERQAPYDDAARQAWQRCFETQSRWFIGWVKKVRSATVTLADCRMEAVPVAVRVYGGEWWLWWIPLPHVGGAPYTHFDLALKIDTRAARRRRRATGDSMIAATPAARPRRCRSS